MHVLLIVFLMLIALFPGSKPNIATIEPPLGVDGAPASQSPQSPLQLPLTSQAPATAGEHALMVETASRVSICTRPHRSSHS